MEIKCKCSLCKYDDDPTMLEVLKLSDDGFQIRYKQGKLVYAVIIDRSDMIKISKLLEED